MKQIAYTGGQAADTRFHDGALPLMAGACHIQVMRANREHPELSQGTDFTYNHAPMLCRWRGWFYLMYLSGPVHEHAGCARAMLTRSRNGFDWETPRLAFPDIAVPPGVYRGKGAQQLAPGARTIVHHRMGFYTAPNGVLLMMTHHGVTPDIHILPNSGYGMGRVVRRIHEDGSLGAIHVLRVNTQAGWTAAHFPYPWFEESGDKAFVEACRAVLCDPLANGAWWEEERLDEAFFPLKQMRAPSFCPLPDGATAAIGKMGLSAISADGGRSWSEPQTAPGIITSGGKCMITRTGDGRFAILYNPSPDGQHRWPLAAITSGDGYTYRDMCCACGEVPPIRYGGYLKSIGINYIRGIMPGNDDAPDGYTYAVYSMNKEDIWFMRIPRAIRTEETAPVHDDFSRMAGRVPEDWHIYSPCWARVALEDGCLVLHDSEPYDYAKAVRLFPRTDRAAIRLTLTAQGIQNGMLQLDAADRRGLTAMHLTLCPDGMLRLRGGNGEIPVGRFEEGRPLDLTLGLDCRAQQVTVLAGDQPPQAMRFMNPVLSVERLILRTGPVRLAPTPEDAFKDVLLPDLPGAGERLAEAVYRIAAVDIE